MKKILPYLIGVLCITTFKAQTNLSTGDIAFMSSNADGATNAEDEIAFVLLIDIEANTQIIFTDRGWTDGSGFSSFSGDGEFTWTSTIARSAGDIITLPMTDLAPAAYSTIGDQLFAIQGSIASPIFIAGLQYNDSSGNDSNWDGAATSNSTSALPNALLTGDTAVRLSPEQDNWQFSCVQFGSTPSGTPAELRAILHNPTNWQSNNSFPYNPAVENGCTINVMDAGDSIPPNITCAPTPNPIMANTNGMAAIPDLITGTSATDDTSASNDIVITQMPSAGTIVGVGVHMVTLTATDEAGNSSNCTINVTVEEPPSTTLGAGDIAFVGFNLDGNDGWAFVLLKDVIAGTNIKFTDCGVANPNTINCLTGDSTNTWYAPSNMTAGTVVNMDGSFFESGPLSAIGDQILAYQGTTSSPTFISGIHSNVEAGITNDNDWDGSVANNDESALPDQLTNGVNAIRLFVAGAPESEIDNWQFNCSLTGSNQLMGSAAEIAAIINNVSNWINNNSVEYVPAANSSCTYQVGDFNNPTAVCQNVTAFLNANGEITVSASEVDNGSSDAEGSVTLMLSKTDFTCADVGENQVTLTVTDEAGNTDTCTATITITDNLAPSITCQDDIVIATDSGQCTAVVVFDAPAATDNCNATVTQTAGLPSGSSFPLGLNTIEFTATDASGNANTCSFTITVEDQEKPSIACPSDIFVGTDSGTCSAIVDYNVTSTDNCDSNPSITLNPPSGSTFNVGTTTVTATAEDAAGNIEMCTFTVTVRDDEKPVAACQNLTLNLNANGIVSLTAAQLNNGSTDNCAITNMTVSQDSFSCDDLGENTVTLTVFDAAGNTDTCMATVTVTDMIAPQLSSCPSNIMVSTAPSQCGATVTFTAPTATDNCLSPMVMQTAGLISGSQFPVGVTTVTYTATDSSGNQDMCSFTVTVTDNEAPTISCPEDQTVMNEEGGGGYTVPDYVDNGMAIPNDNCPSFTTEQSPVPGTQLQPGTHTIQIEVTDASGLVQSCSFQLTVDDVLGVGDKTTINDIILYPNPAAQYVSISMPSNIQIETIKVYDLEGRQLIISRALDKNLLTRINVSSLQSGQYFIVIETDLGRSVKSLVRE